MGLPTREQISSGRHAVGAVLGHPLTAYLARYTLLAGASALIGYAVLVLHRWIDLPLALTLYLPLILLAAMCWDLIEVVLILVCAIGNVDYLCNTPQGRLWPVGSR